MTEQPRSPFHQIGSIRVPRVKPRWAVMTLVAAIAAFGGGTWARQSMDAPPNYDIRSAKDPGMVSYLARFTAPAAVADLSKRRAEGLVRLATSQPAMEMDINPELGTPETIGVRPGFGFLTGPSADRVGTMRGFLSTYADIYGFTQEQLNSLVLVADYQNPSGNMAWVEFEQQINGIPVFQGLIRGGFTAQGELVRVSGPVAAALQGASLSAAPAIGAGQAVAYAAASVNNRVPAGAFSQKGTDQLGRITFGTGNSVDAKAWLVYFPLSPGIARLAWATETYGDPDGFLVLIDAEDGTMLFRKNLTNYQTQAASYSVYNDDSPAPHSPTTALPGSGFQAPMISRTLFTLIGNEAPNGFNNLGWMTDGLNETMGNNVRAGLDLVNPDGIEATVAGVARVFNFPYNPGPGNPPPGDNPTNASYRNGEVTDMFFWTNRYHDRLYLLGFTEVARNFQNDNFGRGGAQLDRVNAEGQDASGTDNANFLTPSDGTSGRMQMYIFTAPTPDRTSAIDHDVLLHELTHGTSNRLHNNGAGLTTTMSGGMGEGWSDFYARSILSGSDEDPDGIYTTGGWITYQIAGAGYTDNYYYGIRRFPYASRRTVGANGRPHNPLTFADIDGTQINLTDGAYPRGPIGSATAFQVHNVGEVWASMLFEVRALLIKRLGHAVGNQRMLQFVTDGMKLDPVNPTLIQARNSILAVATASGTPADIDDIWTGFATRGLGYSAQVLNATTGSVIEAFDVPGIKENPPMNIVAETIPNGALDSGETVTMSLCITNTASSPSGAVTGTLLTSGGVQSPTGPQAYGAVAPAGNVCRNFTFVVGPACGQGLTATLQTQEAGGRTRMLTYAMGVGTLSPAFSQFFDGVAAPALPAGWSSATIGGTPNLFATNITTPSTPPNRVFTGDPTTVSDNVLLSASIAVPAGTSVIAFQNHYDTEPNWDGGVLEISINGGAFADIITAGGSFAAGGYSATLLTSGNPLTGRPAWTGSSGGYVATQIIMPPAAAGQNVVLRWRMGTDSSVGATGWAIDTLVLFQIVCSNQAPVITTHPQSQAVMSGNTVTLSVSASGSGVLTYQWYRGVSGDTSDPVGINSPSYTSGPLISATNFWVRVTNGVGGANSNTAVISVGPGTGANLVQNGDFSGGMTNWNVFEEPNIQWGIVGGVFQYWRQNPGTGTTQAVVYQTTGQPVAPRTSLQASFRVGNSSTARKRLSVLIIDADFSDLAVCTFWIAPGSPLQLYTMNTKTTKSWANAAIYFYAATKGQDGGNYLLDDVSLSYVPALPTDRTDCIDPTAPGPGGGSIGPDLIVNGHFQAGGLTGWSQFGSLTWQVGGGIFEFIRPDPLPSPAGVIFQQTGQAMPANTIVTATLKLGNTSAVRKRVTILLQDADFTDLTACTFWLAPFQPMGSYVMVGYAAKAWTNATLAVYNASVGMQTWTQVDDVTFRTTPGTTPFGTRCIEPPPSFYEGIGEKMSGAAPALPDGSAEGGNRLSMANDDAGRDVAYFDRAIDLTNASTAELSFDSMLSAAVSSGRVQASSDGITWQTIGEVPASEDRVSVDLTPFAGRVVYVRFVLSTATSLRRPDSWTVENLTLRIR